MIIPVLEMLPPVRGHGLLRESAVAHDSACATIPERELRHRNGAITGLTSLNLIAAAEKSRLLTGLLNDPVGAQRTSSGTAEAGHHGTVLIGSLGGAVVQLEPGIVDTVLIFADVLMVLISLRYSTTYHIVFRNSGFAVATVLIRLALIAPAPVNALLGIASALFALGLTVAYNTFAPVIRSESPGTVAEASPCLGSSEAS